MYWFIGVGVRNSIDIMVEATAEGATTVVVEMYSLIGMVAGVTANFGPFCSKGFSSGVSSFLEVLSTYLSWILQEVEEVTAVLKVLVVLEVVVENLEI